jgi:hypothetical protein
MSKKIFNQCKLCLNDRDLKCSHIYPKWAVTNCRDEETKRFVTTPKIYAQDGPKEHLLCEECEEKFGRREKYFRELILSRRVPRNIPVEFIRTKDAKIQITPFDFQQVKYFILSILWRLSVTSIPGWRTPLGKEEEEMLRKQLDTEARFTAEFFPTKTFLLEIDQQNDSRILASPHKLSIEYGDIIEILICGIVFSINPEKSNHMFTNFISLKENSWTLPVEPTMMMAPFPELDLEPKLKVSSMKLNHHKSTDQYHCPKMRTEKLIGNNTKEIPNQILDPTWTTPVDSVNVYFPSGSGLTLCRKKYGKENNRD